MCFTMLTQIVYGIIMVATLAFTVGSVFTPGLIPLACTLPNDTISSGSAVNNADFCRQWWQHMKGWERVVIASMAIAVFLEVVALSWNCFTWCACCCKEYLLHPLSPISFAIAVFLAVAVVVYGINNPAALDHVQDWQSVQVKLKSEVGYSFWMAVAALILALADTLVAGFAICLGQHGV